MPEGWWTKQPYCYAIPKVPANVLFSQFVACDVARANCCDPRTFRVNRELVSLLNGSFDWARVRTDAQKTPPTNFDLRIDWADGNYLVKIFYCQWERDGGRSLERVVTTDSRIYWDMSSQVWCIEKIDTATAETLQSKLRPALAHHARSLHMAMPASSTKKSRR